MTMMKTPATQKMTPFVLPDSPAYLESFSQFLLETPHPAPTSFGDTINEALKAFPHCLER